jgi:hypothetical protein
MNRRYVVPPSGGLDAWDRLKPGLHTRRGSWAVSRSFGNRELSMNRPLVAASVSSLMDLRVLVPMGKAM